MRKSLIAICAGLIVAAAAPQSFAGPGGSKPLTKSQKCEAACEKKFDKCVKEQRKKTYPDEEVCKLKRKSCVEGCVNLWR
jgi:hypothetical protein